jgi:DNA-binding transcriptional ArsR family regulator
MEDETLQKILQVLIRIEGRFDKLDELLSVTKMSQKGTIEQTKKELLEKSPFRRQVYHLCDGRHSVSDIAQGVGKSISQVSQALGQLVEASLVSERRQGSVKFYDKVL